MLNHKALHNAFKRVKQHFKGHDQLANAFYKLRGGINDIVSGCEDNVNVSIYIDEVLDDPIEVCAGAGENELVITIDKDANVSYSWPKETWLKCISDAWNHAKSVTKSIIEYIVSSVSDLLSVEGPDRPAIKDH